MQAQISIRRNSVADPYNACFAQAQQARKTVIKWVAATVAAVGLGATLATGAYSFTNELMHGDHVRKEFAVTSTNAARAKATDEVMAHTMQALEQSRKLTGNRAVAVYQQSPRSELAQAAARNPVEIDEKGVAHEAIAPRVGDPQAVMLMAAHNNDTSVAAPRSVGVVGQVRIGDGPALDVVQDANGTVRYVRAGEEG
ncbi:MAG: hypothetical protein Q4G39_01105 [Brachymonas sp.]|nr:hypothetical protein [Brachymonas sp.]